MAAGHGGARPRSGPDADENALRRYRPDDQRSWTSLDPEGFAGPIPDNPLHTSDFAGGRGKNVGRESELWQDLWRKPQAIMWDRLGLELEVALYVRKFAEAEKAEAPANLLGHVRSMGAELGLTVSGMKAHRWRIAVADPEDDDEKKSEDDAPKKKSSRERLRANLKVVDDDADGE